jgi:hypothetical protein
LSTHHHHRHTIPKPPPKKFTTPAHQDIRADQKKREARKNEGKEGKEREEKSQQENHRSLYKDNIKPKSINFLSPPLRTVFPCILFLDITPFLLVPSTAELYSYQLKIENWKRKA